MERKTATQFLKDKGIHPTEPIYWDMEKSRISLDELMEEYAGLQRQIAVEETLMEASDRATLIYESDHTGKISHYGLSYGTEMGEVRVDKQSILSLAPQIIENLNKGEI